MKKLALTMTVALALCASMTASATTVIDFEAVALREADTGGFPVVTELPDQTGFWADTTDTGQKAYYGTDAFGGWKLSDIVSIYFEFKPGTKAPYTNLVITDGSGAYGVLYSSDIASGTVATDPDWMFNDVTIAGSTGLKFYEPVNTTLSGSISWADVDDWYLLGASATRPLSSGELSNSAQPGKAKGPVDHGVTLMWGDSASNYIGEKYIRNVSVVASVNGVATTFNAGPVPEPATILLLGLGLAGLAARRIRRKK